MEKTKLIKRWGVWAFKGTVSALAIFYVFGKMEFREVGLLFKTANWWLMLAALVLFVFSKVFSAYRLQLFFRQIQVTISHGFNLKLYWLGMFYNIGLPGGIGGDAYKVYLLKKRFPEVRTKLLVSAAFMDRFSGMAVLCSLVVILLSFLPTPWPFTAYFWLLVIPGAFAFYLVFHGFFKTFKPILLPVNVWSVLVQGSQLGSAWCILHALGSDAGAMPYLVLFLISSMAAIVPVTIGGIGLREAVLLEGAILLEQEQSIAVGLGLGFYLITVFTSLWGIGFGLGKNALAKPHEMNGTTPQNS